MAAGAIAAAALGIALGTRGGQTPATAAGSIDPAAVGAAAPAAAPPWKPAAASRPSTDQEYFAQLLYLDHVPASATGMLNDPSQGKTLWVSVGTTLHGARVTSLDGKAVLAEHPTLGRVTIPFVGLEAAAPPVLQPYDTSPEALPTLYPPSHDPAQAAELDRRMKLMRAEQAAQARAAGEVTGGGGGGGGGGMGGGKKGQKMGPIGPDGRRLSSPAERKAAAP